jgi:hypothetical protein
MLTVGSTLSTVTVGDEAAMPPCPSSTVSVTV